MSMEKIQQIREKLEKIQGETIALQPYWDTIDNCNRLAKEALSLIDEMEAKYGEDKER